MRKEPNLERRIVGRPDAGKSLQDFLAAWLGVSRRAAKAVIDGRSVWVNRRCVWIAHHTLKAGDTVELAHAVMAAARRPAARREIAPEDYGRTLGFLLGLTDDSASKPEAGFDEEMLYFSEFSSGMLDIFLAQLRRQKCPVALKAVQTETNLQFTACELYRELRAEREAIARGQQAH